jgi:endonuclease YncB( thermonuclease family)
MSKCARGLFAAALILVVAVPALAEVTVIDGDTIKVDGTIYRLWGIDAPEYRQFCDDGFGAGGLAFDVLRELVRGKKVECEPKSSDRRDATVAVCRANGLDLASMMVRAGWAWAFLKYSAHYLPQELRARSDRAGVHGHTCLPAWEWRARRQSNGQEGIP